MVALGVGTPGQRLLDLGCGTGTLARQFATRGCIVTGADVDTRMLAAARSLAVAAGLQVAWWECPAEDTGLPSASFDVVTAAQCWHWFDGEAAAEEVRRLLVSGGLVAVCGFDWLPLSNTVSGVTEALIQAHNPSWNLGGIRDPGPEVRRHLSGAGFVAVPGRFPDGSPPGVGLSGRSAALTRGTRSSRRPMPLGRGRPSVGTRPGWPM